MAMQPVAPGLWGVDEVGAGVRGHPLLLSEFFASFGIMYNQPIHEEYSERV